MEKKSIEYVLPEEIEKRSFEIIAAELAERGITLPAEQDPVTRRVIHTSADFDYAETMTYSENAVEIAKNLIKNGADIVTDTNMALAGINKKVLASFGGEAHCYMADADVAAMAKERKTTRAAISMELASKLEKPVIFAVGNAPTALIQIYELMQERGLAPGIRYRGPCGFRECGSSQGADYGDGCALYCQSGTKGRQQYRRCDLQCADLYYGGQRLIQKEN